MNSRLSSGKRAIVLALKRAMSSKAVNPLGNMAGGEKSIIGEGVNRIDGLLKVTGTANYAMDWCRSRILHTALSSKATIAAGTIAEMDTAAAEKSPGVLACHHS